MKRGLSLGFPERLGIAIRKKSTSGWTVGLLSNLDFSRYTKPTSATGKVGFSDFLVRS